MKRLIRCSSSFLQTSRVLSDSAIKKEVNAMTEARKVANRMEDSREKAIAYCNTVEPYFSVIRYHVDKLELVVDNEIWPLPKYRELLFIN